MFKFEYGYILLKTLDLKFWNFFLIVFTITVKYKMNCRVNNYPVRYINKLLNIKMDDYDITRC